MSSLNNTEPVYGSFEDYIQDIKNLIILHKKDLKSNLGRTIRNIDLTCDEIDVNYEYFRETYDANESPEYVLNNLKYNTEELYRKIDNVTDDMLIQEVNNRSLGKYFLEDMDTRDLEEELEGRWDYSKYDISLVCTSELIEELKDRGHYLFEGKNLIHNLCLALGLDNTFAYTKEEIINEINKRL